MIDLNPYIILRKENNKEKKKKLHLAVSLAKELETLQRNSSNEVLYESATFTFKTAVNMLRSTRTEAKHADGIVGTKTM